MQNNASLKKEKSINKQILTLFLIAFCGVCLLWISIHKWEKHRQSQSLQLSLQTYLGVIQSELLQASIPSEDDLENYGFKLSDDYDKDMKVIKTIGDQNNGYQILQDDDEKLYLVYTPIYSVLLKPLHKDMNFSFLDLSFFILLFILTALFLIARKALAPINKLCENLINLKNGEFKILKNKSSYKEISHITNAYNSAISHIKYLLETREMFNKIFMHEMKTPLAKCAFYLKSTPSVQNQENLARLFSQINDQLENFRILEEIVSTKSVKLDEISLIKILEAVKSKLNLKENDKILAEISPDFKIYGESELWQICLKNIIENAINYSPNHTVQIIANGDIMEFINDGDVLPLDISVSAKNAPCASWKLDKSVRHKSSRGYGFGLFIIQKTAILNGYDIAYSHENSKISLKFCPRKISKNA